MPGQWDDGGWESSTDAGLHYNVSRWYEAGLGRYTQPDPIRGSFEAFQYGHSRPTAFTDRLALQPSASACCDEAAARNWFGQAGGIVVCCEGTKVGCPNVGAIARMTLNATVFKILANCTRQHEQQHFPDLDSEFGIKKADYRNESDKPASECRAAIAEVVCLSQASRACGSDTGYLRTLQGRIDSETRYGNSFGYRCPL
jgi:RHS repeat-associated protein